MRVQEPIRKPAMTWLAVIAAFAAGAAAAGGAWFLLAREEPQRSAADLMDAVMWGRESVGGPFALVDQDGQPRTDADFRGKLLLIYFGFTACVDACPTDLQAIAQAMDGLGSQADAVQPLFITIDPVLDGPEQLKSYTGLFHPRLIGLTGSAAQIKAVAQAYKVYARRSEPARRSSPEIDHSGLVYLVDAAGRYVGYFPPGTPALRMMAVLRPHLARAGSDVTAAD